MTHEVYSYPHIYYDYLILVKLLFKVTYMWWFPLRKYLVHLAIHVYFFMLCLEQIQYR